MQTESVAVFSCRKTMSKDPGQVLFRNAVAVVVDLDLYLVILARLYAQCDSFVLMMTIPQRVRGIADQVHKDLKHQVPIGPDHGNLCILGVQLDAVAVYIAGVQSYRLVDEIGQQTRLHDARHTRMLLL